VVLDPLKLKLVNFAAVFGSADHREPCDAPVHPARPELGRREFALTSEVWIERDDFMAEPSKGFFRLSPPRVDADGKPVAGSRVRLKYGYIVECTGVEHAPDGTPSAVLAELVPDTKSGTPGADRVKVKGVLTWVGAADALAVEVRLYDRLFKDPQPEAGGHELTHALNPDSKRVVAGYAEPGLAVAAPDARFQFERHGYFVADRVDHRAGRPVFNRTTTLKDTWTPR
jgi:glutaminyl-tRNA synthetase